MKKKKIQKIDKWKLLKMIIAAEKYLSQARKELIFF